MEELKLKLRDLRDLISAQTETIYQLQYTVEKLTKLINDHVTKGNASTLSTGENPANCFRILDADNKE